MKISGKSRWMGKAVLAVLLSFVMAVPTFFVQPVKPAEAAPTVLYYGDVNQNGIVEAVDALAVLKHIVKIQQILDETSLALADVDQNKEINATDALQILKIVVKITPAEEYREELPIIALVVYEANSYGTVLTSEEKMELSGSIIGKEEPKSLKYTYSDSEGIQQGQDLQLVNGEWKTEPISFSIGSNPLTFTLVGKEGTVVEETVVVYRMSDEVSGGSDVVVFDVDDNTQLEEVREIKEGMRAYAVLDKGTESKEDDECELIVEENSPLYQYMKNGSIKQGELVYIPANEYFPMGLTFRYRGMDDVCSSGESFQASTQEVIHGQIPSLMELFEGDGCLASDSLDGENPIAFVCGPIGTRLEAEYMAGAGTRSISFEQELSFGSDNTVKKQGFQFQNLTKFNLNHNITAENGKFTGNMNLRFDDIILYDEDGSGSTKEDRIVLDGRFGINDIQPIFGFEWKSGSKMPDQMISTIEYTENADVKATFGKKLRNKKDLLKGLDYSDTQMTDDLNSAELFGCIKLSGVDLSDTIIIGAIGLRLDGVQVGTMRTIQNTSCRVKLNPILVLTLYVDVNGNLETSASISYEYSSYRKKGVNVQKEGYVGAYGSCESNNNGCINSKIGSYQVNIYNTFAKSKNKLDEKPEHRISISADGKADALAGIGVGVGCMISGIVPAYAKAGVQLDAEAEAHGALKFHWPYKDDFAGGSVPSFVDSIDVNGDLKIGANVHTVAEAAVRLVAAKEEGIIQFSEEIGKTFTAPEVKLAGWEFSAANIEGTVHEKESLKALQGATVTLTANKPDEFGKKKVYRATTDANGNFLLKFCKEGTYTLKVSKDEYVDDIDKAYTIRVEPNKIREKENVYLEKESVLQRYLKKTLIPKYGLSKESQSGVMRTRSDAWLKPEGLASALIYDLDNDLQEELLVVRFAEKNVSPQWYENDYMVYIEVYEEKNGEVVLADTQTFTSINEAVSYHLTWNINVVHTSDQNYIFCEKIINGGVFADGSNRNFSALLYKNSDIQKASAFSQTAGGSSGFVYSGFKYNNGVLVSEKILYADPEACAYEDIHPLYNEFSDALIGFFAENNIQIKKSVTGWDSSSILSEKNDIVKGLGYSVKCTQRDYKNSKYTFQATLTDYTELRKLSEK